MRTTKNSTIVFYLRRLKPVREREREIEMIAEIVEGCVYQEPLSIYRKGFYGVTLLGLICLGISEVIGKHLQYSKFWNSGSKKSTKVLLPSKIGMLLFYTPALFACIASFGLFPNGGIRFLMFKSALTIHFLKRDLEVLIFLSVPPPHWFLLDWWTHFAFMVLYSIFLVGHDVDFSRFM